MAAKLKDGVDSRLAALEESVWPLRVDSSSWQKGEAAVRRRLTLERHVTSTLLPDCAIKPSVAETESLP